MLPQGKAALVFVTHSEEETFDVGRKMAGRLQEGDVLLLYGDLGAGKTCLARGIVAGLHGGAGGTVKSPSYTLLNIYEGRPEVYHFDLYRLESGDDLGSLGLDEYWGYGICLVEWPREFCLKLPGNVIEVAISIPQDDIRKITVKGMNDVQEDSAGF